MVLRGIIFSNSFSLVKGKTRVMFDIYLTLVTISHEHKIKIA